MLYYIKENGFPMSISIETMSATDPKEGWEGYESIVCDMETGNVIDKFTHKNFRDRVHWANGFFTGLKLKEGGK